jgi:integrase
LSDEEIGRVFEAAKNSGSATVYPALMLSILTGVRFVELRHLTWSLIDLTAGTLRVGKSKTQTGEGRFIHLPPLAVEVLNDWKVRFGNRLTPQSFVFPGRMYGRKNYTLPSSVALDKPMVSLNSTWDKILDAADVKCRWHDLRHSCATRIAKASGGNRQLIRDMFGWSSDEMMKVYLHSQDEEKKEASMTAFDNPAFLAIVGGKGIALVA